MKKFNSISNEIYDLFIPDQKWIGILSIPHSGETIPDEFRKYLTSDSRALMEDVDYKVRDLVDIPTLVDNGVVVMAAKIHRACVDLNRAADVAVLNWKENTHGVKLVEHDAPPDVVNSFLERYHTPYFKTLAEVLDEYIARKKNTVSLIDLHSMPSRPTAYHLKLNPNQKSERSDFCVSDLKGLSCVPAYIDGVVSRLSSHGYSVAKNDPYFGGYVTKYVDTFDANNIQIEINRSVYMDEVKKELIEENVRRLSPVLMEMILTTFKKF